MKRLAALFLAAQSLLGCIVEEDEDIGLLNVIPVRISKANGMSEEVYEEHKAIVLEAEAYLGGRKIRFDQHGAGALSLLLVDEMPYMPSGSIEGAHSTGISLVMRGCYRTALLEKDPVVIAHEIMHMLGNIKHNDEPNMLMNPMPTHQQYWEISAKEHDNADDALIALAACRSLRANKTFGKKR